MACSPRKDRRFKVVTAIARKTGKELWRVQWQGAMTVPFLAKPNGDWFRATPACDGESLFIAVRRGATLRSQSINSSSAS
jgi:hypothetical protein